MPRTLVICGLHREAARAVSPNVTTMLSGGSRQALEARLAAVDPASIDIVVSFGLAGGLDPALSVSDVVVPDRVIGAGGSWFATPALCSHLRQNAVAVGLRVVSGAVAGVDAPILTARSKAVLRAENGTVAVDMESHVAGAYAARSGLPFGVLRVISDGAGHAVPQAAVAAMREDGGIDIPAVLRSLLNDPRQIPALIRTARDGARAFRVLGRVGGLLRGGLGLDL